MANGSRAVTFAELDRESCRVSRLLAGLGVGPGDHVAVLMAAQAAGWPGWAVYFDGPLFEYHNDPVKTANSRNGNGWSTLGDIGHLDDEEYLYLSDRRTDLILSGGVNIYPAEIEEALIMHPAVADVAVIGVPDAEMGESVLAIVQLAEGGAGSGELAADLMAHCRSRLASFKCPRSVEFTAELPRTPRESCCAAACGRNASFRDLRGCRR
jgi:acyl-coenzyme A synthetase/AMP-(fatty) acid ligase